MQTLTSNNQNQNYGRRTGQHEQPRQQATLLGCAEAVNDMYPPSYVEAFWPNTAEDVAVAVAFFNHADRIEIDMEEDHLCELCNTMKPRIRVVEIKGSTYSMCQECREDNSWQIADGEARRDVDGAAEDAAQEGM